MLVLGTVPILDRALQTRNNTASRQPCVRVAFRLASWQAHCLATRQLKDTGPFTTHPVQLRCRLPAMPARYPAQKHLCRSGLQAWKRLGVPAPPPLYRQHEQVGLRHAVEAGGYRWSRHAEQGGTLSMVQLLRGRRFEGNGMCHRGQVTLGVKCEHKDRAPQHELSHSTSVC